LLSNSLNVEKDDLFLKPKDHPEWQMVQAKISDIVG
jgi:hypothetical protein